VTLNFLLMEKTRVSRGPSRSWVRC